MANVGVTLAVLWALALPARAQTVKVDSLLFEQLQPYAADTIEHIVCLYGSTHGDTVQLSSFYLPNQNPLGHHGATADADKCAAALAIWHDHAVPRDSAKQKLDYLYFTLTDQHTFLTTTNAPIAIVGVDGVWCLWTRQQVQAAWAKNLTPLPMIVEQCLHN
jgi:hypothetical protein